MGVQLNPYLGFDGTAREAMEFYQSIFGGDLTVSTFGEFGDTTNPEGVMHAQLTTESGLHLMASDLQPGTTAQPGNTNTISLFGDSAEELHGYWDKLAEGATVTMPMEMQMWGDEFGMLNDRYGIPWMVNISGGGEPAPE